MPFPYNQPVSDRALPSFDRYANPEPDDTPPECEEQDADTNLIEDPTEPDTAYEPRERY